MIDELKAAFPTVEWDERGPDHCGGSDPSRVRVWVAYRNGGYIATSEGSMTIGEGVADTPVGAVRLALADLAARTRSLADRTIAAAEKWGQS